MKPHQFAKAKLIWMLLSLQVSNLRETANSSSFLNGDL